MFDDGDYKLQHAAIKSASSLVSLCFTTHVRLGEVELEMGDDNTAKITMDIPCNSIIESHQVQRQLEELKSKLEAKGITLRSWEEDPPEERQAMHEPFGDCVTELTFPLNLSSVDSLNSIIREFARDRARAAITGGYGRAAATLASAFPEPADRDAELTKIIATLKKEIPEMGAAKRIR